MVRKMMRPELPAYGKTILSVLIFFVASVGFSLSNEEENRMPIPEESARRKALKKIHDTYGDGNKATDNEDRESIIRKLLHTSQEKSIDPALLYACLEEVIRLATRSEDLPSVLTAAKQISKLFIVSPSESMWDALAVVDKSAKTLEFMYEVSKCYLDFAKDEAKKERYQEALAAVKKALAYSRKTKSKTLEKASRELSERLSWQRRMYVKSSAAMEQLKEDLLDVEANLVQGQYLCFAMRKWRIGLPYLLNGTIGDLRAIVTIELFKPSNIKEYIQSGDHWWKLAKSEKNKFIKDAMTDRAIFWYRKALPDITGIQKDYVDKRLSEDIPAIAKGLVLHYDFDEKIENKVVDRSLSGNHGKVVGATWRVMPGRGGVMVFDGKNDYVDCGNDGTLDLSNEFSLSVWVNVGKFKRGVGIVSKYQKYADSSFTLRESFNTKDHKFSFGDDSNSVVQKKGCLLNKWYHIVVVVNHADLRLYFNGKLNNISRKDRPLRMNKNDVNLGRCYSTRYFQGALDNVRIYKRVLDAKEVRDLYASEK